MIPAVKQLRDKYDYYVIRDLAENEGHRILYQPPHHPDFQATGLVPLPCCSVCMLIIAEFCWAHVKTHVRLYKTESKLRHVKDLITAKMDALTPADWEGYCKRVDACHVEMWEREEMDREILQGLWNEDNMQEIDDYEDYSE